MFSRGLRYLINTVKFTKSHEWIQTLEGGRYRVGITDHAQQALGEIVHIEHPALGKLFNEGVGVVTIESVKTTADVYSPAKGKLVSINQDVIANPSLINQKPDKSWIFEVLCDNPPQHGITKEEYERFLRESQH